MVDGLLELRGPGASLSPSTKICGMRHGKRIEAPGDFFCRFLVVQKAAKH